MSQESQTSEQLTSSQVCYLMLLQDTTPEEILDLDFSGHPMKKLPQAASRIVRLLDRKITFTNQLQKGVVSNLPL
jgi:hypothetical protein